VLNLAPRLPRAVPWQVLDWLKRRYSRGQLMSESGGERLVRRFFKFSYKGGRVPFRNRGRGVRALRYKRQRETDVRSTIEKSIRMLHRVVSNLRFDLDRVVVPGRDTVVASWSGRGLLSLWPQPPIEMELLYEEHHFHIERGRISAVWSRRTSLSKRASLWRRTTVASTVRLWDLPGCRPGPTNSIKDGHPLKGANERRERERRQISSRG
jgi:hypothetical protein